MSITVNILYTSTNGQARKFAEEMVERNIVKAIRAEEGNEKYDYPCVSSLFPYFLFDLI